MEEYEGDTIWLVSRIICLLALNSINFIVYVAKHFMERQGKQLRRHWQSCKKYLGNEKCDMKHCKLKHPKVCKFWAKNKGRCNRENSSDFLHVTLVREDENFNAHKEIEEEQFKCVGCNTNWTEKRCVVTHKIENETIHFCVNCEDWIKDKSKVLDAKWSLFDENEKLRIN